jgi:hypothetical protein
MKKIRRDDTSDEGRLDPQKTPVVDGKNQSTDLQEATEPDEQETHTPSREVVKQIKANNDDEFAKFASFTESTDDEIAVSKLQATSDNSVEVPRETPSFEPQESSHSTRPGGYEEIPEATVIDAEPVKPPKTVTLYPTRTLEFKIHIPNIPFLTKLRHSRGVTMLADTSTAAMLDEHLRSIPRQRLWFNFAVCSVLVVMLGSTHLFSTTPKAASAVSEAPRIQRGSPTFATVLPTGKAIATLGGWARVSPPGRDPVYAYIDKLAGVQINVSEQPLPASFKDNPDQQLSQLAQNFEATNKITAGGTTVYIGTSIKGPQSVLLTKSNLLILIKSTGQIPNGDWAAYINSLK